MVDTVMSPAQAGLSYEEKRRLDYKRRAEKAKATRERKKKEREAKQAAEREELIARIKQQDRASLMLPKMEYVSAARSVWFRHTIHNQSATGFHRYACMGSIHSYVNQLKKYKLVVEIAVSEKISVTLADVHKWAQFMNLCGFPCTAQDPAKEEMVGILRVDSADYATPSDLWTALTCIRYLGYHFQTYFPSIPYWATRLYAEFPELDAYQALCLAHYKAFSERGKNAYWDSGHAAPMNQVMELLTVEEARNLRHSNTSSANCNMAFTRYLPYNKATPVSMFEDLARDEKFREIIDLLTIKK